jgi:D-alanine transaminase
LKPRFVWVNGRFRPYGAAAVHVEDRGFQFGDGVYEVWAVLEGRLVDDEPHMARLRGNVEALGISEPLRPGALRQVLAEALRRNRVREGLVYVQITRGVAPRSPYFPQTGTAPSAVVIARPVDRAAAERKAEQGSAVVVRQDDRWGRCDLKTTGLLANVLAKEAARGEGADEAWLLGPDGRITEGASSTAWIVDGTGRLRTGPLSSAVLPGVTRARVLQLAEAAGLRPAESAFTPEEVKSAQEAFGTSASTFVQPVVRINGSPIGHGRPGPVTLRLRSLYLDAVRNSLG